MTTTTLSPQIAAFAAAVRAALADLPPEELDDLTDGLEADLTERADDGAPDAELGDPVAYAEELRAAAGYPPRAARTHLGAALPNLRTLSQQIRARASAFRSHHAWLSGVIAFLVTLRPVWWVLRGWAAYALVGHLFGGTWSGFGGVPGGPIPWIVLLAAIVVSVQLGRGRWLRRQSARVAFLVVSAGLAIGAPFLLANASQDATDYAFSQYEQCCGESGAAYSGSGLTENGGQPVTNIFAYDGQGNPIPRVQLFDQDGKPLNAVNQTDLPYSDVRVTEAGGDGYVNVPSGDVPGRAGWNVYPLGQVDYSEIQEDGTLPSSAHVTTPTTPFDFVKPLSGSEATPASSPVPTPAPTP